MTRSPLFYPLNRGMDAEAGGAADLQTDVMRFMAILALCLVAIFALVQSIPLAPESSEPATEKIEEAVPPVQQAVVTREQRHTPDVAEPEPAFEHRPVPPAPTRESRTAAAPASEPAAPPQAPQEGFTLRFETDSALTKLVSRDEVGLYAIAADQALRMNINRGDITFWSASLPQQYHEMDETTVPDNVVRALRRSGKQVTDNLKWGVTLPAHMSGKLRRILTEHASGALVIASNGELRLEQ